MSPPPESQMHVNAQPDADLELRGRRRLARIHQNRIAYEQFFSQQQKKGDVIDSRLKDLSEERHNVIAREASDPQKRAT